MTSSLYKTNRFQVAVRLFSNRSQRTSKCGGRTWNLFDKFQILQVSPFNATASYGGEAAMLSRVVSECNNRIPTTF